LSLIKQIVYCCWIAFELVYLYFFVVETKGRTLEETAALFDGEEAEHAIADHAAHDPPLADVREDGEKVSTPTYDGNAELKA
jgi:hypothetical protein